MIETFVRCRGLHPFGRALVAMAACCATAHAGASIVFADDFSQDLASGSVGSATQYQLISAGVYTVPPGYRVISDPAPPTFTNGYNSYYDHTTGLASGAMLFFDGAGDQRDIYSFTSSLTAGTQYTFSFWGSAASTDPNAALVGTVDGIVVGTTLMTTLDQWTQFSYVFTAATTGPTTFAIYDSVVDALNNDGAIDDVMLVTSDAVTPPPAGVPEPGVLLLLGAGAVAAAARRRRTHDAK